ncbi:MAG: hypothetical protein JOZ39_01050 [Chloroflexi bacterium]|nr:hypothetical protein [Chloroflexota bacterium]
MTPSGQGLELLERQEALLREGLAATDLPREQRRVQGRLLRQTRQSLAEERRAATAMAAGYEPFSPSPDWLPGFIEDPRWLHGQVRLAAVVLAAIGAAGGGAAAALTWRLEIAAAAATALVFMAGIYVVAHAALGRIAEQRDSSAATDLRIFNSVLPPTAVEALQRARQSQLFDTYLVYSPRPADFRIVQASEAPSLGLLDPVLAGRIGERLFLLAQWDLGRDLA